MKCQIEGCDVVREDLSQHIRIDHNMPVQEYKLKFNVKYVIDEEKRLKRGASRRITNQLTKQFKCEICGEACLTKEALDKHYGMSKDAQHSYVLFNETNIDDWVQCEICGLRRSRLDFHLLADHNMSKEEYEKTYNKSCLSENFVKRSKAGGRTIIGKGMFLGSKNPFYGKHHSEFSKNSIGLTIKLNNSKKFVHHNKGRSHTEETRKKMSESRIGSKNPMFGKQPNMKTAYSIHGYRKDIGHSVRSTLEANYARYLVYNNIEYEFEPKPFVVVSDKGEENCWIDFYLPQTDEWVELKNYQDRNIDKIELIIKQYPNIKLKILYADSDEWQDIDEKYSKLLPLWETQAQNLRTRPDLYTDNIELQQITNQKNILPIEKSDLIRLSEEDRERLSEILFKHYRETGFPDIQYSEKELVDDFYSLRKFKINIVDKMINTGSIYGYKMRDHFIKEQYANFVELFKDDIILRKLIRNRLGLDRKTPEFFTFNDRLLIRGFEVLFPEARFSKYNASIAKWIVDTFCEGDNVFDYSCGWGARLMGTIAANKNYIGVDTNSKLVDQLNYMGKWLCNFKKDSMKIFNVDAAKFKPNVEIDLAYSCPPYGIKEKYQDMIINSDDDWFKFYFQPVVKNCFEVLKYGGKFVCHISIVLSDLVKYELGKYFEFYDEYYVATKYSPFVKNERQRVNEVILVYQKS